MPAILDYNLTAADYRKTFLACLPSLENFEESPRFAFKF
jgi:hypothetical protein